MGLLQNGFRHNLIVRYLGSGVIDGANPGTHVYQGHRTAANRNATTGLTDAKASVPDGNRHPVSWVMAQKNGGMSARQHDQIVTASGVGVLGMPGECSAEFSITTNTPAGELIVSGQGTAAFVVSLANALLTASINGVGESSFTITTNIPILGAEASLIGDSSFSIAVADAPILPLDDTPQVGAGEASFGVSGEAWMLPLDDTSPLREATATFSFTGALVPYATGSMAGSTQDLTGMTPITVAQAVWAAVANEFDGTGTMGQKLNAAGTAGDPWTADLSAYASGTAGFALDNVVGMDVEIHPGITLQTALQALLAVAAGKASGGGSGAITFRDVADTKNAVVLNVDATGNRTSTTVS